MKTSFEPTSAQDHLGETGHPARSPYEPPRLACLGLLDSLTRDNWGSPPPPESDPYGPFGPGKPPPPGS